MTDDQEKSLVESIESLNQRLDRQNKLLDAYVKNQSSFKGRFIAGLWTGLGTVLGATVLVSMLILMLKPLSKVDWISPIVNRVIDALESRSASPRHRIDRTDPPTNNDAANYDSTNTN